MTTSKDIPKILICGDRAITIAFENKISAQINAQVRHLKMLIENEKLSYIDSLIPTYRSLTIIYRPESIQFNDLTKTIEALYSALKNESHTPNRHVKLPVCYDPSLGTDLAYVSEYSGLSAEDIIKKHTHAQYLVYMLGFTPGFPYLGGMDKRIAVPRKKTPNLHIKAGSVGIASEQTGVYSVDSPGGWQIIGQTPLKLYDPSKQNPFLLDPGDTLSFEAITLKEFNALSETVNFKEDKQTEDKSAKGITILSSGALTTIQDSGRKGFEGYGVTTSGVMDTYAYQIANMLVNNPENAAVLELTMSGPSLRFNCACLIAITGADMQPKLNGVPIGMWRTHFIPQDSCLSFGIANHGIRAYLAIKGGITAKKIMHSQSTDIKAKLGGLNGTALKPTDIVPIQACARPINTRYLNSKYLPSYPHQHIIRIVLGPQDDYFSNDVIADFLNEHYVIDPNSNRMGYRLNGPAILPKISSDIISDAVVFGSIQVTNSGQPIIMMADHQTTGGYAKIATVISADLPKLAQALPGDTITFKKVSIEKAQQIYQENAEQFNTIKCDMDLHETQVKQYQVKVNQVVYDVTVEEKA